MKPSRKKKMQKKVNKRKQMKKNHRIKKIRSQRNKIQIISPLRRSQDNQQMQ